MHNDIERHISDFSGQVGISFLVDGSASYGLNEDSVFPTASTMKIFVLGAVLESIAKSGAGLDDRININEIDLVGGSGIIKSMSAPLSLSLRDIAMLMITLSDNTATNVLIDWLGGVEALNSHIRRAGLNRTFVESKIDFNVVGDDYEKIGVSTPSDMTYYLEQIRLAVILDAVHAAYFRSFLCNQHYLDMFPRKMPFNPYAVDLGNTQDLMVANKTGFVPGVRCDVGYVFASSKVLTFAVMTKGCEDLRFSVENEGNRLIGELGEIAYSSLLG